MRTTGTTTSPRASAELPFSFGSTSPDPFPSDARSVGRSFAGSCLAGTGVAWYASLTGAVTVLSHPLIQRAPKVATNSVAPAGATWRQMLQSLRSVLGMLAKKAVRRRGCCFKPRSRRSSIVQDTTFDAYMMTYVSNTSVASFCDRIVIRGGNVRRTVSAGRLLCDTLAVGPQL